MIGLLEFDSEMKRLEAFTGKSLSQEQTAIWFGSLKHLPTKALHEAIGLFIETGIVGGRFPAIGDIRAKADGIRPPDSRMPTAVQLARPKARDDEYTRLAKALFGKACSGKMASIDLAGEMFEMENRFPNRGWFEEACGVLKRANDRIGTKTPGEHLPKITRNAVVVSRCCADGCQNPGTMSPHTGETNFWVCREHWKQV